MRNQKINFSILILVSLGSIASHTGCNSTADAGFATAAISEASSTSDGSTSTTEEGWSNTKSLAFVAGDSTRVETDGGPVSGYPFTISFWVKTSTSSTFVPAGIFRSSASNRFWRFVLYSNTNGTRIQSSNTTNRQTSWGTSIEDGSWHHVVGVFRAANDKELYVDGQYKAQNTQTVNWDSSASRFSVGRHGGTGTAYYFTGNIDEVAIWDTDLSANGVDEVYNNGAPSDLSVDGTDYTNSADLVLWWRMGDDANDDVAGTGNMEDNAGTFSGTAVNFSSASVQSDVPN